jgi:hypothetical protein
MPTEDFADFQITEKGRATAVRAIELLLDLGVDPQDWVKTREPNCEAQLQDHIGLDAVAVAVLLIAVACEQSELAGCTSERWWEEARNVYRLSRN